MLLTFNSTQNYLQLSKRLTLESNTSLAQLAYSYRLLTMADNPALILSRIDLPPL